MTIGELLKSFEEYYGAFDDSDGLRLSLVEYLREEIDPDLYDRMRLYVIRTHARKFGPPDVASLERARVYAYEKDGVMLRRAIRGGSWSSAATSGETFTDEERDEGARLIGSILETLGGKQRL